VKRNNILALCFPKPLQEARWVCSSSPLAFICSIVFSRAASEQLAYVQTHEIILPRTKRSREGPQISVLETNLTPWCGPIGVGRNRQRIQSPRGAAGKGTVGNRSVQTKDVVCPTDYSKISRESDPACKTTAALSFFCHSQ